MHNFRVLMAIETFLPLVGGAEKQALLQCKYLRSQEIDATIITLRFQRDCPAFERVEGVPVLRIGGGPLAWRNRLPSLLRPLCYLLALLALGWQLWRRRHDYEILHVFQLTLFTLPALLICRLTHKPLVIGMRCDSPSWEKDQCRRKARAKSRSDLEGLARLGRPALRFVAHQLRKTDARILVLSAQMRESLRRYGLDVVRVQLIPNGVDTLRFHPFPKLANGGATVICVAKLRYQKGIDLLLQAWRSLVEQAPEARLLIVGDGPLLASLSSQAAELGIASCVEFVGLARDVTVYLRQGRVAVLPSRWEGMPNALLEAMACGLSCVATRVSGSEDLLGRGERGLLVEPGDIKGLTSALLLLLKDTELAENYGRVARTHIEQNYALSSVMQKYIAVYYSLLHIKNANGGENDKKQMGESGQCAESVESIMRGAESR